MALFLDLFDRTIKDQKGEDLFRLKKCEPEFFERIVSILPVHVAALNKQELIKTLEVLIKRELGADRLYQNYLFLSVERHIMRFNVNEYCRTLRALSDKGYVDDVVFWDDYMFKWVHEDRFGKERSFSPQEAKKVWDTLFFLKLRCPSIDLRDTLKQCEKFMPAPK